MFFFCKKVAVEDFFYEHEVTSYVQDTVHQPEDDKEGADEEFSG